MDGIHDMGGMHGFGAVAPGADEPGRDEPVFLEPWEGRMFGLMITTGAAGLRRGLLRPDIESMPPADYLRATYYERWLHAVERGLVAGGQLAPGEIDERVAHPVNVDATADPAIAARLRAALQRPNPHPPPATPGGFDAGDAVQVRRMAPVHHTRCPRYVRGVVGTIATVHGGWPRPDDGGEGEPETLYTVRFAMRDLWGADAEPGHLYVDLWDSYLEEVS